MSPKAVLKHVQSVLTKSPPFKIDYIELVDPISLQRLKTPQKPALLAAAAWLGRTRLIDNVLVK